MSDAIISVEGLGKRYRLGNGGSGERYTALRDVLAEKAKSLFRRNGHGIEKPGRRDEAVTADSQRLRNSEEFWALKDVSFEVKQGEVVGIIGRNGAGKSTLLKILSRITEPTEGRARIKGRVASLLEVGTGFHPELTGRENVYLNGAILGMPRAQIKGRFDAIVAFAEVEKFIDTPVKRYSSGMYVRLAFAVAAHLEPEVLIIDEVLAVGDAQFQRKCLGKMQDVASREGRTILFVSHNTEAICALCSRCLWLRDGQSVALAETPGVVARYLSADRALTSMIELDSRDMDAQFRYAQLSDAEDRLVSQVTTKDTVTVRCTFAVKRYIPGLEVALSVLNFKGERLFYSSSEVTQSAHSGECDNAYRVNAILPSNLFLPGRYFVNLALHRPNITLYELLEQALSFDVIALPGEYQGFSGADLGIVKANIEWQKG